MIFLLIYVFLVSSISHNEHRNNTTFCICVNRKNINCTFTCKNFQIIGYKNKEILKATQKFKGSKITFLIHGTTDSKMPEFNLNEFTNISLNIVSATKQTENIILNGFDKESNYYDLNNEKLYQIFHNSANQNQDITDEIYSHFQNLNIYFQKGKYLFNHLLLYNTIFIPYSNSALSKKTTISQNFLTCDFISFSNIPSQIKYISPTHRIQIICNENVNHIHFFEDHQILLEADSSLSTNNLSNLTLHNCTIDLRNLKKNIRATIVLVSRNLQITFHYMPTDEDEIPKIDFKLKKSAKIFIDTNNKTFSDKLMKINNIKFIHGASAIYFHSNSSLNIPTFDEEGIGTVYKNDEVSLFENIYCICEGTDCQTKCGSYKDHIIPFDIRSIDKTVIGNPYKTLKYVISNSQKEEGKHPIFDLEHFGDKILTVFGMSKDEHIEFIGDGTDDVGIFSFTNLIFHGNNLLFPEVFLHDVRISEPIKKEANSSIVLNSTKLKGDVSTLKNIFNLNISIIEPLNGYEIHTTNILNQVSLMIMESKKIKIDDSLILSFSKKTMIKIFGSGIVNIFLEDMNLRLNMLPNLRIYLEGDKNVVTFPGLQWPDSLRDISSKLTLIHNENDVFVNGDTKYEEDPENPIYKTIPPIVDHEGTGAFFLNGKLSNYDDKYCICEPIEDEETIKNYSINCEYLCQDYGSVTGFSSQEIEEKAIGNPIRSIQYYVVSSSKKKHPKFDLEKFSEKSFSIIGIGPEKQYISLIGTHTKYLISTTISHQFHNLNIEFDSLGFYFFNNVELSNCKFYENITFKNLTEKNKNSMIEYKKNAIRIHHSGMTIDLTSLKSIYEISPNLIYPSKNYLIIDGGYEFEGFSIENNRYISLYDNQEMDNGYLIDVSMLSTTVQLSTSFNSSLNRPFFVHIKDATFSHPEEIPSVYVDIANVQQTDSYVMFTGRKKWDGEFHNLANKITVSYGQTNIHLMTKLKKNTFFEKPPHVTLIGDGEYYVNDVKQGSVFAPGDSVASDNDNVDDEKNRFGFIFIVLLLISACCVIAYFVYKKVKKNRNTQTFFDRWKDEGRRVLSESDISLSHFEIDLEDVNMSD